MNEPPIIDLTQRRAAHALTTDSNGHYGVGIYEDSREVALDFYDVAGYGNVPLALSPKLAREIAHYLILQAERVEALEAGRPDPWPTDPDKET